jgi:hypothetical protein
VPAFEHAICPRCGQRAPILLRGIDALCTACGAKRLPFTGKTLNLAGKGSRIGGAAARFFGWATLVFGTSIAAFLALIFQSIWPEGFVGYAFAIPVMILSVAIGVPLVLGGKRLGRHGEEKERQTRLQAIRSLAAHRRGAITARDVAAALAMPELAADALLTDLARNPDENVSLDLDDNGNIYYLFGLGGEALHEARWRIAHPDLTPGRDAAAEAEAAAFEQAQQAQGTARRT